MSGSGEHATDTRKKTVELPTQASQESPPSSRARHTLPVAPLDDFESSPPAPLVTSSDVPGKLVPSSKPPRRSREPIAVDDVGAAALDAASRPPRGTKPKVVKSRKELAVAPLGPREAFLLSFIDGKLDVRSLVDVSGMPEAEVMQILTRLRRLAIVAYG